MWISECRTTQVLSDLANNPANRTSRSTPRLSQFLLHEKTHQTHWAEVPMQFSSERGGSGGAHSSPVFIHAALLPLHACVTQRPPQHVRIHNSIDQACGSHEHFEFCGQILSTPGQPITIFGLFNLDFRLRGLAYIPLQYPWKSWKTGASSPSRFILELSISLSFFSWLRFLLAFRYHE